MFNTISDITGIAYILFILGYWFNNIFLTIATLVLSLLSILLIMFVIVKKQKLLKPKKTDFILLLFFNITTIVAVGAKCFDI